VRGSSKSRSRTDRARGPCLPETPRRPPAPRAVAARAPADRLR
jgi:hypothetical protein